MNTRKAYISFFVFTIYAILLVMGYAGYFRLRSNNLRNKLHTNDKYLTKAQALHKRYSLWDGKIQYIGKGIPKIVHLIYATESFPGQYIDFLVECAKINNDMKYILWTDEIGDEFVETLYPDAWPRYKSYTRGIDKANLLRLFVMHYFGGVYMDMDMECRKMISETIPLQTICLLDEEMPLQSLILWKRPHMVTSSVMVCKRGHPFYKMAIERIQPNSNESSMKQTGPLFIQRVYDDYLALRKSLGQPSLMDEPNYLDFSPLVEPFVLKQCRKFAHKRNSHLTWRPTSGCLMYMNMLDFLGEEGLVRDSIAIHRFLHLGDNPSLVDYSISLMKLELEDTIFNMDRLKEKKIIKINPLTTQIEY